MRGAPSGLEAWGRPPASGRWPVLFRFPGACGMRDFFGAGLRRLGPPGSHLLFMAEAPDHGDVAGARHFGTFAVQEPGRLGAVHRPDRPGFWVAMNAPVSGAGPLQWVPPSVVRAGTVRAFLAHPRVDEAEHAAVVRSVLSYLEEISVLAAAGAPPPPRTWVEVAPAERARIVAAAGGPALWTGRHDLAPGLLRSA